MCCTTLTSFSHILTGSARGFSIVFEPQLVQLLLPSKIIHSQNKNHGGTELEKQIFKQQPSKPAFGLPVPFFAPGP